MNVEQYSCMERELRSSVDIVGIKRACALFSEKAGFDFYSFRVFRTPSITLADSTSIDNYPQSWSRLYEEDKLVDSDPVIACCIRKNTSVRWDKVESLDEYCLDNQREFRKLARRHGLNSGFSIPLWAPGGEFAMLSLASTKQACEMDLIFAHSLPFAHQFAHYLFEAVQLNQSKLQQSKSSANSSLTNREQECLSWACEGKTTKEIAEIVGIGERTVVFHINHFVKKLGASNRQHAVAKASFYGLVRPSAVALSG
ncbi:MAG: hypothetical protein COC19_01120 [SAR86 cluster bacterium]|uniref:HTH luxR-type domain-containing protein n=1 Tax=SAR86 cluster bacterium TaxID=2030880 RepID=A0A2A4MTG3_9GAMM|nr:MAG: hypothetical protein COC19_01120 [SAR86 cluster bacterium]